MKIYRIAEYEWLPSYDWSGVDWSKSDEQLSKELKVPQG
jgi:hypothetical protein